MIEEKEALKKDRCLLVVKFEMIKVLSTEVYLVGQKGVANLLLASLIEGIFHKLWLNQRHVYEFSQV